jgi:ATP-binding cassette subfamily C protein
MPSALLLRVRSLWRRIWRKTPIVRALGLASPRQRLIVIGGLFVASVFELFGLMMIIPLIAAASGLRETKGAMMSGIRSAMESVGLPFNPSILLGLIVLGLTLKAVTSSAVTRYVTDIVTGIGYDMQERLTRGLLKAEWGFFLRQPLGRLTHATGPEAIATGEVFLSAANIISLSLQAILFLVVCGMLSWQLTILGLIVGSLMLVSQDRLVRGRRLAARAHRAQMRRMAASFTDVMIGIKPLRAMGKTDRFIELFAAEAKKTRRTLKTKLLSADYVTELQEPFIGIMIAVVFYIALGTHTLGAFRVIAAGICFVRVIGAFVSCQKQLLTFSQLYDQYESVRHLLREIEMSGERSFGSRSATLKVGMGFEDVVFRYHEQPVLNGASLTIRRGEITALIGPSGIGKTTVIDLFVGLYQPQHGRILVDGVDLREIDIDAWRRSIGYVPQEINLFHDTVFNNVALWEPHLTRDKVIGALAKSGAWSFVSQLPGQLDYVIGERGNLLSGGQRQRLSLARALVHDPQIVILDEATTGLDRKTESEICRTIRDLCTNDSLTVVAISHQLGWMGVADTVYRLHDGKLFADSVPAAQRTVEETLIS